MSCCGRKREAWKDPGTASREAPGAPDAPMVLLQYNGQRPVRICGVPSGAEYRFSPTEPRRHVRAEDVNAILRTGAFLRL